MNPPSARSAAARFTSTLVAAVLVAAPALSAHADADRFAEEPTEGILLPAGALAGDYDATAISLNPAGLVFLGGRSLDLGFSGFDAENIDSAGSGVGLWLGAPAQLPFLPRLGLGVAYEQLIPPRSSLAPDPGEPGRLSFALASAIGRRLSLGATWHHFFDAGGDRLDGTDTFDLGLAGRLGSHWALGLVVRDLFAPTVDGVPVQRRYLGEVAIRPTGTDRFELGLGLEVGERRHEWNPRVRVSVRVAEGAWVRGAFEAPQAFELVDPAFLTGDTIDRRLYRATLGFELSFGTIGASMYATGGRDADGDYGLLGGSALLRVSEERRPPVQGDSRYLMRVDLDRGFSQQAFTAMLLRLRAVERDEHAAGVFLSVDGLSIGWGDAQELRDAVRRLRAAGKPVYAHLVAGSMREYYVAASADRIFIDPAGGLRLVGLATTVLYFKDLFDLLGVTAWFEKIEEYKSAPESWTRSAPSLEAKAMRDWLIDSLDGTVVADIARDRKVEQARMRQLLQGGPYTARTAGELGLVDAVAEPREVDELVAKALHLPLSVVEAPPTARPDTWAFPQLAVIYLDGDIVDGKSQTIPLIGRRLVGGDTISEAIAWARANPRVKAIVLRIDSPGGSALASEVIAREVFATRGKKPILVSLANVAASGGYFAAAGGDLIYADPLTVTGSIGIFYGKFDVGGLLSKLGITWDTAKRGPRADMDSYLTGFTDEERKAVKDSLRYFYGRFTGYVARGRKMTPAAVDKVGRGQVFTGLQARERQLIDRYGGIVDTIGEAKRLAGYSQDDKLEIVSLPAAPSSLLEKLLGLGGASARVGGSSTMMMGEGRSEGTGIPAVDFLLLRLPGSLLVAPNQAQARLPFDLVFD